MNDNGQRIKEFYKVLNKWMFMKNEGKNIDTILCSRGIKKVAIFGMGDMARHVIKELEHGDCEISGVIDFSSDYFYEDIQTKRIEDFEDEADIVIYTDAFLDSQIVERLKERFYEKVFSLSDIIFERF